MEKKIYFKNKKQCFYLKNDHQNQQIKTIEQIEDQVKKNKLTFSTVDPVSDYINDNRLCLTSVHLLKKELIQYIKDTIIHPLRSISPELYYYEDDSLHATIKNIRTISNPPLYSQEDINISKKVFELVIPKHSSFRAYYYRLLLFPMNLALIGTTDPELDSLILNLDKTMKENGISDNKQYFNNSHFFSNITLARFNKKPSLIFINMVHNLSQHIKFPSYLIDSVTLLISNAVLKKRKIIGSWKLKN